MQIYSINFEKAKRIKFEIKNISNEDIIVRIEKKFYNDVKTGFESVDSDSSKKVSLELTRKDAEMKELVIALLRNENEKVSGKLKVTATVYE